MRRIVLFSTLLLLSVSLFAAPKVNDKAVDSGRKSRIVAAVDSKSSFTSERLFAVLDSVGGTGTWMEWDINGVKDPSVMSVLDPLLKQKDKPSMVWVISEREKPLMAVLVPKGKGEVILFYELAGLDAKPEKLSLNRVLNPDVVFRDYRQVGAGDFVHLDKPNLKISADEKRIMFTYEKPDASPLRMDTDFKKKNMLEKHSEVMDYMGFMQYEYSLMLRAFIQSTRGLFNWQPWHWYDKNWTREGFMTEHEMEAILVRGVKPDFFTVLKLKAAGGETIEFKTSGNGFYQLLVTNP